MHVPHYSRSSAARVNRPEAFDGEVYMQPLHPDDGEQLEVLAVFFSPGGRTRPHYHPTVQVLHVVEGEGLLVTLDEKRTISTGDVAFIPAGTWHWHGATRTTPMTHLSIKPFGETDWTAPLNEWPAYGD
jgi:quercetin dioxygenase-like cupin family protein